MNPGGLVRFAIFVATTLLALEQAQRIQLATLPLGASLFVVGIIALILLVRHETRTRMPLIPMALLRQSAVWHSDAMAACHGAALVSLITFLPVYLEVVRGASPSETGLLLVPLTIGIGTGSLVTGRFVSKTGLTMVFPIGGLLIVTINLIVLAFWAASLSTGVLVGVLLLIGLFMGTVMGVVQVTVQSAAGSLRLGEAAASVQFSRSIGAASEPPSWQPFVRRSHIPKSGNRPGFCNHGRARRPDRTLSASGSASVDPGRHCDGVSRCVSADGDVHNRRFFPGADAPVTSHLDPTGFEFC